MSHGSQILLEAFELQNLSTNTSLLDYGLQLGLIERNENGGQMTIDLLNLKLMTKNQMLSSLLLELLIRIGIFIPAVSLVKMSLNSQPLKVDDEELVLGMYIISIIIHQIKNFDELTIRSLNRILMVNAIILFTATLSSTPPCDKMKKFRQRIQKRLSIDYYLWCLVLAKDLVLTCSSPIHINLEREFGADLHIFHILLSSFCVAKLGKLMTSIGHGRLVPLIVGTPLLFLDAGDDITLFKGMFLLIYYLCFWDLDWRELVDWNHSMLCRAGVCHLMSEEPGNFVQIIKKAKTKFDDWRLEEGLDDDGWFILLDTPPDITRSALILDSPDSEQPNDTDNNVSNSTQQQDTDHPSDDAEDDGSYQIHQEAANNPEMPAATVDYTDRVIYLQSRNPLLTSLASIMIAVWK